MLSSLFGACKTLFRYSVVEDLGPILGTVVRLVAGNPITRYYWAQAHISCDAPPIDGVLEIMNFE